MGGRGADRAGSLAVALTALAAHDASSNPSGRNFFSPFLDVFVFSSAKKLRSHIFSRNQQNFEDIFSETTFPEV